MVKKFNGYKIFKGRTLIIATMHHKEKVIAPILEKELGVYCKTVPNLNTDTFGTFTGEVERKENAMVTVKAKALAALERTTETLVIASEGSFGAHPSCFFMSADEEMVILLDKKNNIEIRGRHLTTETNFNHQEIKNINDMKEFESRIGFPDHGIILKTKGRTVEERIFKNFPSSVSLRSKVNELLQGNKTITAETDMRAMNNPTRMKAIEKAVIDLVSNVKSICPKCNAPGFSVSAVVRGLRCSLCNLPTKSVKGYIYMCEICDFSCEREKENITQEDPTYCDFCNP
ncbi:DUF6671 family protein [Gelidibacter japonicus]|jgi:hypothetical protein|uniref:DUF6671 family protein n=1 Tax=Gelidibacter japonicus TaxID=1962232 RepID=UPI003A8D87EF